MPVVFIVLVEMIELLKHLTRVLVVWSSNSELGKSDAEQLARKDFNTQCRLGPIWAIRIGAELNSSELQ